MLRPYKQLVRRFAVDQKRDLQLQDVAIFAEAKSQPIARCRRRAFSTRGLERLLRLIGGRPFHSFAARFHRLRIDFVGFLVLSCRPADTASTDVPAAVPFLRVINVPRFRRSSLNFTIAKATDFQRTFFSADCERAGRGKAQMAAEKNGKHRGQTPDTQS